MRNLRSSRSDCEKSLIEFIRQSWHIVEPGTEFVEGWHLRVLCDHLEHVKGGENAGAITRLLVNIPPGTMKSLTTSVFFVAWLLAKDPTLRVLCFSHSQNLALRDSVRCRRILQSDWFQARWPDVKLAEDQNAKGKFEIAKYGGFREAVASGSITGSRGDILICDDPHSVQSAASQAERETTRDWWLEAVPTRLNQPGGENASAIICIMQRLHEEDVSGICLSRNLGYEHLCLPMEMDTSRRCETSIGFVDHRDEGDLLFPERFPREVVERDKHVLGPYAYAGQYQQTPMPKGGYIFRREWFTLYDDEEAAAQGLNSANTFPGMDFVVASLDSAYTTKTENDASALTIWGVWQRSGQAAKTILTSKGQRLDLMDDRDTLPCVMLMTAWEKRLPLHGPDTIRYPGESDMEFRVRQRDSMGLIEWVMSSCSRFNVNVLLVEAKASGISVAQEIKRLNRQADYQVQLINPGNADKVARAYAVQAIFSNGQVYAPDRDWADKLITQCEQFPKAAHDDMVDSTTQALKYLRERGLLRRSEEIAAEISDRSAYKKPARAAYDV